MRLFVLRWRDVTDRFEQLTVNEPVNPLHECQFNRIDGARRSTPANDFGFEPAYDRLGHCVVVRIADAAD